MPKGNLFTQWRHRSGLTFSTAWRRWLPFVFLVLLLVVLLQLSDRTLTAWLVGPRARQVAATRSVMIVPPGGVYSRPVRVALQAPAPGAPVIFNTDGSVPTATVGLRYTTPWELPAPGVTVLRARAFVEGQPGPLTTTVYGVGVTHTVPLLSLAVEPADLWSAERGLLANASWRGRDWERPIFVTLFETTTALVASPAGLRVHPDRPYTAAKPSWRLYWRGDYGAPALTAPLFADHPAQAPEQQTFRHLLLQAGDRSGRWTLLLDPLVVETAQALGLPAAQGRPVLLFINSENWGLYRLSERVDRFFLEENFGLRNPDLICNGKAEEGDLAQWAALRAWVATHDLAEPAHYQALQSQMDLAGFTDFMVLQLYFGFPTSALNAARPHNGGGRWFWVYGEGGDWGHALAPELPLSLLRTAGAQDESGWLFHALLANPGYRAMFARRVDDLLNTVLAPEAMGARVEHLAAQLRPDIGYETARWPAPGDWEANVQALQSFVAQRPAAFRTQLAAAWGLGTPLTLTLSAEPSPGGAVWVSGLPVTLPWTGLYATGSALALIAVPVPGYGFAGWEGVADVSPSLWLTLTQPLTLTAHFRPLASAEAGWQPDDVIINEYWINDNGTAYVSLGGRSLEGDWVELLVQRSPAVDLRGWRLTDNDTKTGTAEGSLIFPERPELAAVPRGTVILIIATETAANAAAFPTDDLDAADGRLLFYVGNGTLDSHTDPGFGIGTGREALALLAPGPGPAWEDDQGIDFVAEGNAVTPFSFGILADGVVFPAPFRGLGGDDGASFTGQGRNDDAAAWRVDPPDYQSGDARRLGSVNQLTPGALNPGQRSTALRWEWVVLGGCGLLLGLGVAWRRWHTNHRRPGAKRLTTQQ